MPSPWVLLGALALSIAAYFYGHTQGEAVVQAQWQAEKAEANAQAAIAINKAQEAARATERYQAQKFQQVEAKLLEENRKVQNEKNDLLAAARAGVLRVPGAKSANNSSGMPETAARASSDQPETVCYLPEEFVRSLANEAERADQITLQLTACQMILEEERK
jgi:hypothetical protein